MLVAEDLAPVRHRRPRPAARASALVTERGGPTSHTAIIARQLGIPCVVGTAGAMDDRRPARRLLVDGTAGTVELDPDEAEAERRVAADVEAPRGARRVDRARRDGRRQAGQDPRQRRRRRVRPLRRRRPRSRASGCSAPSCASSTARTSRRSRSRPTIYGEVLDAFGRGPGDADRYVVVRTLDAGSDKPVAFATLEGEENPALGVRGLRLSFDNPGLLDRQLDGDRRWPRARPAPRPG